MYFFCVSYWFNCFSGMTGFLPLTIVNLSLRLGTNQAMPLTIYCCSKSCSRCLKREPLNLINVEFVKESLESNDLPRHPSRNLTLNFWDYLKPNFEMPYSSSTFSKSSQINLILADLTYIPKNRGAVFLHYLLTSQSKRPLQVSFELKTIQPDNPCLLHDGRALCRIFTGTNVFFSYPLVRAFPAESVPLFS